MRTAPVKRLDEELGDRSAGAFYTPAIDGNSTELWEGLQTKQNEQSGKGKSQASRSSTEGGYEEQQSSSTPMVAQSIEGSLEERQGPRRGKKLRRARPEN